ncbi:MAG: hypothetical protein CM1200mP41_34830 [Gammaproteobacteria bacterium]|nr:MAG: hypothetical protein CM1200mP41_34830 [Gammaproteobacteria bacterium]
MPAAEELLARERTVEQVAAEIGADRLFYQTLDDLVEAARVWKIRQLLSSTHRVLMALILPVMSTMIILAAVEAGVG